MKNAIGFQPSSEQSASPAVQPAAPPQTESSVPSLVYIRFSGIEKAYAYYNDRFDLHEGDRVFVSGKLSDRAGRVESVNTHFRLDLSHYERVLARADRVLHGAYSLQRGMMVSRDADAVTAEQFRSWEIPPADPQDAPRIVSGEGYCVALADFPSDCDLSYDEWRRAGSLCQDGNVIFLSLKNGVGRAFLREERTWITVDFTYRDGVAADIYCDCLYPQPGMCRHMAAVLQTLDDLLGDAPSDPPYLTAFGAEYFWHVLSQESPAVRL